MYQWNGKKSLQISMFWEKELIMMIIMMMLMFNVWSFSFKRNSFKILIDINQIMLWLVYDNYKNGKFLPSSFG